MSPSIETRNHGRPRRLVACRAGLTLIELMFAGTISTLLVGAMALVAATVNQNSTHNAGCQDAVQHARVVMDRLSRFVGEAYATETYPGVVVVADRVGGTRYPDTVLIWRPGGAPVNAAGPPLIRELLMICPDPANPGRLLEVTMPTDARTIELNDASLNTTTGRALVASLKTASTSVKTLLTPLMRTATISYTVSGATAATRRGAVRFECELRPTAAQLTSFRGGSTSWNALNWPQGLYGSGSGTRQVWLRTELQLLGKAPAADGAVAADAAVLPFFGSATLYYCLTK